MNSNCSNPGKAGVRATLVLAVLAALQAANGVCATPTPAQLAAPTRLVRGDVVVGALPMAMPIHVVVGLKLRDRAGLEAFVREGAETMAAGGMPRLMSADEALARHAPTQAQAQAVADYLAAHGFRNVTISPSRMLVSADGTAQTAGDAFMTSFAQVRTRDGRFAYANTDAVRVPAALAGTVESVLGLQNVHMARSFIRRAGSGGGVHTMDIVGHSPVDFPAIYGVGTAAAATSVPVGIVVEGNLAQTKTDLKTFTTAKGLATVATATVGTGSADTAGTGEWDLDSQDIVGMSGGVQKLVFYVIPTLGNGDLTTDFDTIRTKDAVKIINVSLGECEAFTESGTGDGSAATDDAIFILAAAQGQTFSVSTGDSGADECGDGTNTPSYPAASPYVVAAAGTRINTSGASETTWIGERSWTNSGGSPSTFEPMPAWQTAFGVTGTMRGVADIAFEGDPNSGSQIYVNGNLSQFGGTSLSAPLFAGLWARVLQAHPGLGFAAPMLYQLPASAFHDITTGKNSGGEAGIGFNAVSGYDFATGRGSLKIAAAVNGTAGLTKQLFFNTGFESTTSTAWTASPTSVIVNNASNAHAGSFYASMGGSTSSTQTLQQTATITAGKTLASVRFYLKTTTAETGTTVKDTLSVDAYDTGGHLLGNLGSFSNLDAATTGYVQRGVDASAFIGQKIAIRFTATNNSTNATTWSVDDVTLSVE